MAERFCLVDSNVLLRWGQSDDPLAPIVLKAISELARKKFVLCFTSQNIAEFWNVCTRPLAQNGYGLTPEDADRRADAFETSLFLLPDSALVHYEWRRLLVAHRVSGAQVHDTRLVAAMHVHGVELILTFNVKDFARFPGVQALLPQDVSPTI